MKKLTLIILFFAFNISLFTFLPVPQAGDVNAQSITWQKVFPDYYGTVYKVQQTFDGGYVAVGTVIINNQHKIRLIKFNPYGDTLWQKIFGVGENIGYWVEETYDRGLIICGQTDSGSFYGKAYLIKTDSVGNIQWQKTYSNIDSDDGCKCVRQMQDRGHILACVNWPNIPGRKIWLIKTDSIGNIIWQKFYGDGLTDLIILELQILNDGYIASGFKEVGSSSSDALLMKFTQNGDTLWTRTFGGNDVDIGYSVVTVPQNNGYVFAGYTKSFDINNKLESYIVKTDTNGILQWQRTYSNLGWEGAFSIRYKPGQGYVFAGYSDSLNNNVYGAKIRAIDISGNLIFENSFHPGIADAGFESLELTSDGGYILGGNEESPFGGSHMYVVKTDSLGHANAIGINNSQNGVPDSYILYQNYPNPFNPSTRIKFDVPVNSHVKIIIYDVLGREVKIIIDDNLKAGSYEVNFNASNLASGVYYISLTTESYRETRKMILIK